MSYLPIIRFKNRWQTFDLNLHYPYSVNEKIITYTHLGYRGDACYIVDNECNTYYLPHDYAEIINDALKLHSSIYNECNTDSCRRQIITKLENINRHEYGRNDFELLNSVLAEQSRDGNYIHDRILYDTTCNKAYPTVTHVDSRIDGLTSAGAYSPSGELIYRFDNMRNLNLTAI